MNIGLLKKRITLQHRTKASDGIGGYTDTWVDKVTVFAEIWGATAKDRTAAASVNMEISHKMRIRYIPGVKASWKVKFGDRYFAIVSIVNPKEENRTLELSCKEVT